MGIYDRDYWRDRYNKLSGYKETAAFRNPSADDDLSDHAYFAPSSSSRRFTTWQLIIYLFAFFGFVDWVKVVVRIVLRFL